MSGGCCRCMAIHAKSSTWRLAPVLEEVPTDAMLPETMVQAMGFQRKAWDRLGFGQD